MKVAVGRPATIAVSLLAVLCGCGSSSMPPRGDAGEVNRPSDAADASLEDATSAAAPDAAPADRACGRLVYTSPGCQAEAKPVCVATVDTAAALVGKLLCGCDGKTFQGAGTPGGRFVYSDAPYRFEGCCPEDPPMFFRNQCVNLEDGGRD